MIETEETVAMLAADPPGPMPRRAKHEPSPMNRSRPAGSGLRWLAIALAIALAAAFVVVRQIKSNAATELADDTKTESSALPVVEIVPAEPAPATWNLKLPGETAAWYDSKIYARVNGYVGKWVNDIGDHVEKGQILATIETPDLDADLAAAKAKLAASGAQVQVKQADADFAKSTYERWRDSPAGSVSKQEQESKKAGYESAEAQLAAAKAQVETDEADVARLTALTEFKLVKAPFAGIVTQRNIDIGNLVTAGSTSSTMPLYRISADDPIRIFVDAPQSASSQFLKPNVAATITTIGPAPQQFEGKVTRTSMSINDQARTLRVEIDIPNSNQTLVPGMYVEVAFELKSGGAAQVPAAAMIFRAKGPQVAVVDGDDHIRFRDVTIGADNGNVLEIAEGVKVGDKVALNVSSQIADGEKVKPSDASATPSLNAAAAK
jgi:RND family efflux transporter MFP subunit